MLVSNTDTTTSLSRRTSFTAFLTASSNSSSLFNTCSHTNRQEQTHLLTEGLEKKKPWKHMVRKKGSNRKAEKTILMLGKTSTHHQGIKSVNQCERKPAEEKEKEALWWEAQHGGAGVPLYYWSSLICNEPQTVKCQICCICREITLCNMCGA